ncbi:MAG: histidine kinase [Paludibacter sp.]|nr:histidine kinase [Paludibacter sp.]
MRFLSSILQRIKNAGINWKLAILFSAILPALNLINNSQQREFDEWYRVVGNWILTFLFLICSWMINGVLYKNSTSNFKGRLSVKRILYIILINGIFLVSFVLVALFLLNDFEFVFIDNNLNLYLIAFRGFISISLIYLIQFALYSGKKAQVAEIQNEMLKTENMRARFEILRQQVNPHFLFNSLSTLRSMIYTGDENAEQFVLKLSEVYRQLLQKRDKEMVTLSEELEFLDDYSFMLFTRFERMLSIGKDIDSSMLTKKVPTFSLQILVENCIKHNVISKDKHLQIKIYNSGLNYLIVENNLHPKITHQEPSGFGLNNLIKRYELLGEADAVNVFTDETVFRVKIKLLN